MTEINIRQTIAALEVGEFHDFPIEKYEYVLSCRTRLQKTLKRKYPSEQLDDVVRITRTE